MQPLLAQDFRYNSPACIGLRGIPPIPLKMGILQGGGRGVPTLTAKFQSRNLSARGFAVGCAPDNTISIADSVRCALCSDAHERGGGDNRERP
jgi:hypothetical protein